MNTPIVEYNRESKIATVIVMDDKGRKFKGIAKCDPQDSDFASEITGLHIAEQRAMIQYLKSVKRDELIPALAALKQLYYSINRSKHFNNKSYEARALIRQIKMKEMDVKVITEMIKQTQTELKKYIADKDILYAKLRKLRDRQSDNLG